MRAKEVFCVRYWDASGYSKPLGRRLLTRDRAEQILSRITKSGRQTQNGREFFVLPVFVSTKKRRR